MNCTKHEILKLIIKYDVHTYFKQYMLYKIYVYVLYIPLSTQILNLPTHFTFADPSVLIFFFFLKRVWKNFFVTWKIRINVR